MKFRPAAAILTTASPLPGAGIGASSRRMTSGPPQAWTRMAFIIGVLSIRRLETPADKPGQTRDDRQEFARFHRFRNVHLITGRKCFDAILDTSKSRQRDRRNFLSRRLFDLSNAPDEFVAVDVRH